MNANAPKQWEVDPAWYAAWCAEQGARWRLTPVPQGPLLSLVMPCHNTPGALLHGAIDSIRAQSYQRWELCIADDGSTCAATLNALTECEKVDERIRLHRLQENRGIAVASNAALALASGAYVIPMDHDDLLPYYALAVMVHYLADNPGVRFAYSDSDRIDSSGSRCRPFFKPDWNYELFLAQNYLNHLTAIETQLLRSIDGWREGYEGSQDYDLYLRLIEQLRGTEILHVPHVLYHWREAEGSFSQTRLGAAVEAARRAIRDHLSRTRQLATVSAPPGALIYNHVRWSLSQSRLKVQLVLLGEPSDAVRELRELGYPGGGELKIEIQSVSGSAGTGLLQQLDEALAEASDRDVVILVNATAVALPEQILSDMVACCMREEAGCVGVKCMDGEGRVFAKPEQLADVRETRSLYSELWRGATGRCRGYFAQLLLQQCTDILRPDAIAFRRSHLEAQRSFGSRYASLHLAVADFCLATALRGARSIWLGPDTLQFEDSGALVEDYDPKELLRFRERWRRQIESLRFADKDIEWATPP